MGTMATARMKGRVGLYRFSGDNQNLTPILSLNMPS